MRSPRGGILLVFGLIVPSSSFQPGGSLCGFPRNALYQDHRSQNGLLSKQISTSRLYSSSSSPQASWDDKCDVLVLGSGPAARAAASLLAVDNLDVLLSDQRFDSEWPPNYGVWKDEWQSIIDRYSEAGVNLNGSSKCPNSIDREWSVTDCYFGGSFDKPMEERMRLDRPYQRVDKNSLREVLSTDSYRVVKANHISQATATNIYSPAGSLVHDEDGTTIQLRKTDGTLMTVRTRLVIDCTGHETKLTLRESHESNPSPGFQIAYGALVDVKDTPGSTSIGPYDKEAMTLFDYRTDHFDDDESLAIAERAPTFMYAMPLYDNKIFFEETSLVARPAVSFQECKERCIKRLKHLGIEVTGVDEEEFCYIPMGGALPARDQRILALGGAAAIVHPSTGYHICRCLMGAADLAAVVRKELSPDTADLDKTARLAYDALWSPSNIRQRNFAVFGGDFLMKQNVEGLRGFFDGFFKLPLDLWGGFLAGWPGLPNNVNHETWNARLWFGLNFVVKLPPGVALAMATSIVTYSLGEGIALVQSVTPFFGEPRGYNTDKNKDVVGDLPAKMEGRAMIEQSKVSFDLPAFFSDSAGTTASTMVIDELEFVRTKEVQNDVATEEKNEAATELQEAMATEASV